MNIETLIAWLEAISDKNDDAFYYRINIEPSKRGVWFRFQCNELADNHTFIEGSGPSIDGAIAVAALQIADSCKEWGYEFVPKPTP